MYIPGKNLVLADMSRSLADDDSSQSTGTDDMEIHAVQSLDYMAMPATEHELQKETAGDNYLQAAVESLSRGQPVEGELTPFAHKLCC